MSNIQTGAERMPHDLSHLGFLSGQIGRLITISTTPFIARSEERDQVRRCEYRLDDTAKRWKISESDYKERKFWNEYMPAYEDVLSRCSTRHAPWFVIPSDH